jgi:DNA polymerase-1
MEEEIRQMAGFDVNVSSPRQLGEVLFERLKLVDKPKKTKTGQYATGEEVLAELKDKHPIVGKILDFREVAKLKSTYVDALPALIHPTTGRIHTSFNQAVAATGRLSSNNPNLQNIPIRTDRGKRVRAAFIARDADHLLISADYSQIELRLIAELSGDAAMTAAFLAGEDIHAATAAKVFGVPLAEVTKQQRSHAKTVNFGIIYGVSAFGLSQQTNLSKGEAAEIIASYFKTYPGIKDYIDAQVDRARSLGYVETLLGRRRYLRDINSRNPVVRGHAERNAVNAPIQGSAADIIKLAMVQVQQKLQEGGFAGKMILQVHDELVFDVPRSEVEALRPLIAHTMQQAVETKIPLLAETGVGSHWLDAH